MNFSTQISKSRLTGYLKIFLFVYLFTVLSGALRKWFISSKQLGNGVLFLQILVPFLFLFIKGGIKSWFIGKPMLFLSIFVFIIGILNPLNLTLYHGILGFLLHFGFFFILFFYINNRDAFEFEQIMPILVFAGLGQLILAFFQYTQPSDSFINTYADVEAVGSIAIVGTAARVTGTFSYISGFTAFLFFNSLLIWALIKHQYKSVYILLLLVMGIFACFMSGSRGATYLYLIILALIAIAEYTSLTKVLFDFKLLLPILIFTLVLLAIGSDKFSNLLEASFSGFSERRRSGIESGEEQGRIINDILEVISFKGNYPILGVGLGSTYQGANKLFGISPYVTEYGFFESELVRLVLEGGFVLLLTRFLVLYYLLKQLFIPAKVKIALFFLLSLFFPIVFNVYNSTFAALGIILIDHFYYKEFLFKRSKLMAAPNSFLGKYK